MIALTQRDFDVVDRTIDPAIAESVTTNAAPGARLSFVKNDLADSANLPRFVDEMFSSMKCPLPSVTSTAARVSTRQT